MSMKKNTERSQAVRTTASRNPDTSSAMNLQMENPRTFQMLKFPDYYTREVKVSWVL